MGKESRVDGSHVRVTSDDGKQSILYEIDLLGNRHPVEIADHHGDKTDAYKYGNPIGGLVTGDFRGEKKNK